MSISRLLPLPLLRRLFAVVVIVVIAAVVGPRRPWIDDAVARAPAQARWRASPVQSAPPDLIAPRLASVDVRRRHLPGPFPAEVVSVIDGDTIEARVRVWLGEEITTLVRLRGIDAPELKARCGDELRGAQASRDRLAAILVQGGLSLEDIALDKYGGRVVASLYVDQPDGSPPLDVARAMLDAGMARAYGGGARETWCPLQSRSQ